MHIKHIYSPRVAGDMSGEDLIYRRGIGHLYDEIRQCILQSTLYISPIRTTTRRGGTTGIKGLSDAINKGLRASLSSLYWAPFTAPGASGSTAKIDWYKAVPSGISYGPADIGLGLEVQFGNNFQFYGDLHRLSEAVIAQKIVAGVCIVASNSLDKYTSDRAAYFRQEKSKLDRFLSILAGTGAAVIPGFVLIGIEHDGFLTDDVVATDGSVEEGEVYTEPDPEQEIEEAATEAEDTEEEVLPVVASAQPKGIYKLTSPIFDPNKGISAAPIKYREFPE